MTPPCSHYGKPISAISPSSNPDPAGPAQRDLTAALALVDWRAVEVDAGRNRVSFARPGMGLTLNSGAQGYITDRVTDVLRAHGFDRMLVDMGEPRALSAKPDGSAWRIGIANPANPGSTITTLEVVDKCVSTSGGYGTLFDAAGTFTHIMNTRTGRTAPALLGGFGGGRQWHYCRRPFHRYADGTGRTQTGHPQGCRWQ